ncbi:MAG TPA: methyltransferase domain-containing protein [Kofleriaceae bacterium]|nr:methyltransferase domain-containing protein [Kofleriaceae bacterium]
MRALLALTVVAACAHPRAPVPPSSADLIEHSHRVIAAFDTADRTTLDAALHPTFVQLEGGEPVARAEFLKKLDDRKPGDPTIARRTWDKERIVVQGDSVLFIGRATEVPSGNTVHGGGYRIVGWYTLHWIPDGDAWRVRLWTWQAGGELAMRGTWNEIFRGGAGFNHEPNRLLVDTVRDVSPGTALDVAMGQGRNALYLASQGWKVTGVDLSDEGLRQARAEAQRRKLALDTIQANLDRFDFGVAKWDLVTMIYAGDDVGWIEKIQKSLRPGGLFVVEYFANDASVNQADGGFERGQLAKLFATGFTIVRDEIVDDTPDWAMDRARLVRFVARKN